MAEAMNSRRWGWIAPAVIAAAGLAAYANSLHGPLVFDDAGSIAENPTIRHLWPPWAALNPPAGGMPVSGRPLLNFSFALNYAISGTSVGSYHAANLLIHILAGLTLLGIARRTLTRTACKQPRALAFAIAAIWTLHPLQTESVTYISQRAESLMGFFYLLTLYFFIRSIDCGPESGFQVSGLRSQVSEECPQPSAKMFQVFAVAACWCCAATKEVAATAPIIVLLYDRTFVAGSFRAAWRSRRSFYLLLGSSWILLAALVATTGSRGGTAGFGGDMAWQAYALTQVRAIAHYLRLSVWPSPLVFYYGAKLGGTAAGLAASVIVVGSLAAGTLVLLVRRAPLGFVGAFFFAVLAPSSSVIPISTETMAEHRMYLSLAAVTAVGAGIVFWLAGRLRGRAGWLAGPAACAAIAVACGIATSHRNADYAADEALWRDTVGKMPENPVAHNNLGYALLGRGDAAAAETQCREALRLNPAYAKAHANLADILVREGRASEALQEYGRALQLVPNDAETRNNIALALAAAGRTDEAIAHYREAIRLKPYLPEVHNNLGLAFEGTGRVSEAIAEYRSALELRPDYAEAEYNWGNTLADAGQLAGALEHLDRALLLRPGFSGAQNNRGIALARLGRYSEARAAFEAALSLRPDDAAARSNLARLPAPR